MGSQKNNTGYTNFKLINHETGQLNDQWPKAYNFALGYSEGEVKAQKRNYCGDFGVVR